MEKIHINKTDEELHLESVESAINAIYRIEGEIPKELIQEVLNNICISASEGGQFIIPVVLQESTIEMITESNLSLNEIIEKTSEISFLVKSIHLANGERALTAFTNMDEISAGEDTSTVTEDILIYLEKAFMNPDISGVMVNPWRNSFFLTKPMINMILSGTLPQERENLICIETADITDLELDCIVNPTNNELKSGGGVDAAIHRVAGPELDIECRVLGRCETGEAKITKGYNLKSNYIIHTVGPMYTGQEKDAKLLQRCYWNCLELAHSHDLHSIAFPAISTGAYGYPLREATEIALGAIDDWLRIHPGYGMNVMFACRNDKTKKQYFEVWNQLQDSKTMLPIIRENNGMLEKAIQFAMDRHKGMSRQGTEKPFILHPIETLQILSEMNADIELMCAGVLHDTIERGVATLTEIYEEFGAEVALQVNTCSEKMSNIWYLRKLHAIETLPSSHIRHKILVLAGCVANLRNMYSDYKRIGDDFWQRFFAPKGFQAWYYSKINDGLFELQNYDETRGIYWEMVSLYKDIFVQFLIHEEKGLLYQVSADGSSHFLKKGKPQWNTLEGTVSPKAVPISRKDAERIEENWAEPFWDTHYKDLLDADYEIFSNEEISINMKINENTLVIRTLSKEQGSNMESISLDEENTAKFLVHLRINNNIRNKLSTTLKKEFGTEDGIQRFRSFCEKLGLQITLTDNQNIVPEHGPNGAECQSRMTLDGEPADSIPEAIPQDC